MVASPKIRLLLWVIVLLGVESSPSVLAQSNSSPSTIEAQESFLNPIDAGNIHTLFRMNTFGSLESRSILNRFAEVFPEHDPHGFFIIPFAVSDRGEVSESIVTQDYTQLNRAVETGTTKIEGIQQNGGDSQFQLAVQLDNGRVAQAALIVQVTRGYTGQYPDESGEIKSGAIATGSYWLIDLNSEHLIQPTRSGTKLIITTTNVELVENLRHASEQLGYEVGFGDDGEWIVLEIDAETGEIVQFITDTHSIVMETFTVEAGGQNINIRELPGTNQQVLGRLETASLALPYQLFSNEELYTQVLNLVRSRGLDETALSYEAGYVTVNLGDGYTWMMIISENGQVGWVANLVEPDQVFEPPMMSPTGTPFIAPTPIPGAPIEDPDRRPPIENPDGSFIVDQAIYDRLGGSNIQIVGGTQETWWQPPDIMQQLAPNISARLPENVSQLPPIPSDILDWGSTVDIAGEYLPHQGFFGRVIGSSPDAVNGPNRLYYVAVPRFDGYTLVTIAVSTDNPDTLISASILEGDITMVEELFENPDYDQFSWNHAMLYKTQREALAILDRLAETGEPIFFGLLKGKTKWDPIIEATAEYGTIRAAQDADGPAGGFFIITFGS